MREKYAPQLVQKLQLSFPILSDPGNQVAEQFGVVYTLSNGMKEIYKGLGIDLDYAVYTPSRVSFHRFD